MMVGGDWYLRSGGGGVCGLVALRHEAGWTVVHHQHV